MPFPNTQGIVKGAAAAVAVAAPLIIAWEGYDPVAKHFAIDPPGVITVCNGITNYDIPGLKPGTRYSKEECLALFQKHLPRYTTAIDKCVRPDISINTRAALYSAAYNLGAGTVCKSSMVRKINAGDLQGGCDAFMLYILANGKKLKGLINRRAAERKVCLS